MDAKNHKNSLKLKLSQNGKFTKTKIQVSSIYVKVLDSKKVNTRPVNKSRRGDICGASKKTSSSLRGMIGKEETLSPAISRGKEPSREAHVQRVCGRMFLRGIGVKEATTISQAEAIFVAS